MSSMMHSPEEEPRTRSLITMGLAALAIASVTCNAKMAHRRIDELEAYVDDVEVLRSQDRAELDSLKEDLGISDKPAKASKP